MYNICFTIRNISNSGGTERVGITMANALVKRGYNVHIVSYDAHECKPFFKCDERIHLWCILSNRFHRRFRWKFWYGGFRFHRYLVKNDIDVVIDIDTYNAMWTYPALKKTDVKWISWDQFNYKYSLVPERQTALELVKTRADYLVLITKNDMQDYIEAAFMPRAKIKQIYNPLTIAPKRVLSSIEQRKKVLAVGRISYQKGFDLLLKSWSLVEKKVKDWKLEIVCGSGDWEKLQREAIEEGCNNVICTPPSKDIQKNMSTSSIFALSSRYEGFGLVLVEAASMGLPAVSYNCPHGPSEIINDNQDGLLVENGNVVGFAEKLLFLMQNPDILQNMSSAAIQNSKRFYIGNILLEWEKIIKS